MSAAKPIAVVAGPIGVIAAILAGAYFYQKHHALPPGAEPKPPVEQSQTSPGEAPKAEGEAPGAETAAPTVPSFDIVRIEPTGEGVLAGRSEPGWAVKVESDGEVIAETTGDEDGAWSIILDKPLSAGDHALGLRAISPDGTRALTAQEGVKVAVGEAPEQPVAQKPEEAAPGSAPERPKAPIRFKTVDYADAGPDGGKISLAGIGVPGTVILLFFDEQPLGEIIVGEDGNWLAEIDKKVTEGDHVIRADRVEGGILIGRASMMLRREPEVATASKQPEPVYPDGSPPPQPSVSETTTAVAGEPQNLASQPQPVYPEGPAAAEGPATTEGPAAAEAPASTTVAEAAPTERSSQPQPVYPDGPPEPEAAPSQPSATVAIESQDLSKQPQPVYPKEEALAEAAPPQAAPSTPMVTAERPSEAQTRAPRPVVAFRSVDYHDTGPNSGKVTLAGTADPGAHIRLFFNNAPLGEVTVGSNGAWTFETEKKLEAGEHNFRAEQVEEGTGTVIGQASIGMARLEKPVPPKEEEVAAASSPPRPLPAPETSASEPEQQVAGEPAEAAKPAAQWRKGAYRKRHRPSNYIVRRGDTLWEIAEDFYGGGWRYHAIVRDNRRKIRDPHWIYPRQKFRLRSR